MRSRSHLAMLAVLSLGLLLANASVLARPTLAADDGVLPDKVALGIYQPALPNDLSGLAGYETAMQQPMPIVSWYALWGGWKSAFSRADLDAASAHGSLPLITWEPWAGTGPDPAWSLHNAILSGKNDAYIASWAAGLAAYGKPVLLRFAHEMHNQPAYPWAVGVNGNTAADYVAAWKHVHDIFRAAGATNVLWVWNPNTLGTAPSTAYQSIYASLYPGDDQVDYLGLDIYNTGPQLDWGAPFWRSFSQALATPYAAITSVSSKPLILPEVASTETGGSKAQWIQDALGNGLDQFPAVRALVWFDVDKEQPWSLHSSATSLAAWTAASAAPRFEVGPTPSLPPSGEPIQTLTAPVRVVDTRSQAGAIQTASPRCFTLTNGTGIPPDAAAVVLNVTAVGHHTDGWVTVYPNGQPAASTSTLNFDVNEYAIANNAVMPIGSGGALCVAVGTVNAAPGSVQVILDATGYLTASQLAAASVLSSPQRLVDTRTLGTQLVAGTPRCFDVAGHAGVPSNAAGVVLNVTAVGYATPGWLTVYPAGGSVPATSTLNLDPTEYAIANGTIVRLGSNGQVCVELGAVNSVPSTAQVVLDVTGYVTATGLAQMPLLASPQRLVDTRSMTGGPIASGTRRCFAVAGHAGVPSGATAVILNVTAVGYTAQGWLSVYPDGQAVPTTSTLNFDRTEYAMANGAIVRLGSNGQVCVDVGAVNAASNSSQVILDVVGYLS